VELDWLRDEAEKAFIGIMKINVIKPLPGVVWGRFNDREYLPSWIEKLVEMFPTRLKNSTMNKTAMYGAVRPSWVENIKERLTSVEGKQIGQVPLLELSEEGKKAVPVQELWMLSGNHRREALTIHIKNKMEELRELEERAGKHHKKQAADGHLNEENAMEMMYDKEAAKLRQVIVDQSHWAVMLYNRGE
jgi:hypothetical protein